MKKYFLIQLVVFIILINNFRVQGQDSTNVFTAIELINTKILYLGVDNPIKIICSRYEQSDIQVSIDNGSITETETKGKYIIIPKEEGIATLTIKHKEKEIHKSIFYVKKISKLILVIQSKKTFKNYYNKEEISVAELLSSGGLSIAYSSCFHDLNFEIVGFRMSIIHCESDTSTFSDSSQFTEEQIELISNCTKETYVIFEDIIILNKIDGTRRKFPPLQYKILP